MKQRMLKKKVWKGGSKSAKGGSISVSGLGPGSKSAGGPNPL